MAQIFVAIRCAGGGVVGGSRLLARLTCAGVRGVLDWGCAPPFGEAGVEMSDERSSSVAGGRALGVWRGLSALFLVGMGGIHLFLVFAGTGGLLGVLFVVNAVGSVALAVGVVVARQRRLGLVSGLGLLFVLGTLLALLIALSPVSLFGMRSSLSYQLAPTSIVVESVGVFVLAVTTVLALRRRAG
jgi:hypothetical protein